MVANFGPINGGRTVRIICGEMTPSKSGVPWRGITNEVSFWFGLRILKPLISPIDHKNHSENKEVCRQVPSVHKVIQYPPLLTTSVAAAPVLMMTFLAQPEFSLLLEKLSYSTWHKLKSHKNSSKCPPAVAHNYCGFLPCWGLSTLDFYFLTTDVFLVTFGHWVFT